MGRYAEYSEDDYRLPDGMNRIGYDADTQVYTFQDDEGELWESVPGNRYGRLRRVGAEPLPPPALNPRRRATADPPMTEIPDTFEKLLKDDPKHNDVAIDDDEDNDDKTLIQRITAPVKPLRRAFTDLLSSASKPTVPLPPSSNTEKPTVKRSLSQRLTRRPSVHPQPPPTTTTPAMARRSTLSGIPEKPVSPDSDKADGAEGAEGVAVAAVPERRMSVVETWMALGRRMSKREK